MKECTISEKSRKYNYVFFNTGGDYLKPYFFPLMAHEYVRVYDHAFESGKLLQRLFFLHWSAKINRRIKLPLKSIWFNKMCKSDFRDNKPCCYVFVGSKYLCEEPKLYEYIKKLNPENKAVFYFLDLISKHSRSIEPYKKCSDAAITYDRGEAERYGINCFDEITYGPIIEATEPSSFKWDVYFLGFAKDRLDRIHRSYKILTNAGLRCNFIICGTKPEERIEGEGLNYQQPISYLENLENVRNSRCILELMQGGSDSPTLRTQEAITYKRKLLTDHQSIVGLSYYRPAYMSVFAEPEEIDVDFAKQPIDYISFEDSENLSPDKLIDYLEGLLR